MLITITYISEKNFITIFETLTLILDEKFYLITTSK